MSVVPWTVYALLGAVFACSHAVLVEKSAEDWIRAPIVLAFAGAAAHALLVRGSTSSVAWRVVCLTVPVSGVALWSIRGAGWNAGSYEIIATAGVIVAALVRLSTCRWEIAGSHCPACGYCLDGNVSGRCPECGLPIRPGEGYPRLRIRNWVKKLLAPGTTRAGQ
jgi:hypothetical protein